MERKKPCQISLKGERKCCIIEPIRRRLYYVATMHDASNVLGWWNWYTR
jgi:hypothetical protein